MMVEVSVAGSDEKISFRGLPVRVSVEKGDPALLPAPAFGRRDPVVYLDGVQQQLVVTADSEKGIVRRYKLVNGHAIPKGDGFEVEELTGRVEIRMV